MIEIWAARFLLLVTSNSSTDYTTITSITTYLVYQRYCQAMSRKAAKLVLPYPQIQTTNECFSLSLALSVRSCVGRRDRNGSRCIYRCARM
ncbi:hypothetical protein F5887DRAFT_234909 [Amanita rubescens]|nr:hypothetical protein F5887DRAFT_234909 [Amanita rubescens]